MIINRMVAVLLALAFSAATIVALVSGSWTGALLFALLAALALWQTLTLLRAPAHPLSAFERFKLWMTLRPVVIGLPGVLALLWWVRSPWFAAGRPAPLVVGVAVGAWLTLLIIALWRAPRQRGRLGESDAAFKARVGYRERPGP